MKYGLSSKINYTRIKQVFSLSDQNRLVHSFLRLFEQPRFYSANVRIYQSNLDLGDFWESGGAIVIDERAVTVVNPLRRTVVPWQAVADVRLRWQIVIETVAGRKVQCWGGPSLPRPKPARRAPADAFGH